eukprot:m.74791 g.74791  ORF g.74791 m.74791 type:complete len:52 (+) comp12412_c0_seq2:258-413(+)
MSYFFVAAFCFCFVRLRRVFCLPAMCTALRAINGCLVIGVCMYMCVFLSYG